MQGEWGPDLGLCPLRHGSGAKRGQVQLALETPLGVVRGEFGLRTLAVGDSEGQGRGEGGGEAPWS